MNFLKKLFGNLIKPEKEEVHIPDTDKDLSLDQKYVKKFIHKGGKFLYCTNMEEVKSNLLHILEENGWNNVISFNPQLQDILTSVQSAKTEKIILKLPFFTNCESLISEDGSIMFSSKQLLDKKLKELPNNVIVFAKTSQISKDTREGISGIRNRSEKNSATIISSIKDYTINKTETDFMNYGNTNTKTLYLLLLEDL